MSKTQKQAIATLRETGLLEFVDAGREFLPIGSRVQTTYPSLESEGAHDPRRARPPRRRQRRPLTADPDGAYLRLTEGLTLEAPSGRRRDAGPTDTTPTAEPSVRRRVYATVIVG